MILRVGLTGGIASGKSTIAHLFAELGCDVFDADALVAQLYEPGRSGHEAIVKTYGQSVLLPDGHIDRPKLASIAFSSGAEAQRLNALIHPLVIAEEAVIMRELEATAPPAGRIVIIEATLLLESGGRMRYDKIVVVDVDPVVQIDRAVGRGMSRDEVERRMARQMPRQDRLRVADYVIDNSGDLAAARAETRLAFERLRHDLESKRQRRL